MVPGSFPRCYCSSSLLGANQSGQNLFAMPSHCGGYCLVAGATLIWYWSRCRTPMNSSYRPRVITLQIGQIQITRRKSVTFWAASICTGASSTVVDKFRVLRLIILNVFWIDAVSLHQRNSTAKSVTKGKRWKAWLPELKRLFAFAHDRYREFGSLGGFKFHQR